MNTYKVFDKQTGEFRYQYDADAPVEWNEYPFSEYDHQLVPPPSDLPPPVYSGRRKLTKLEWRKLLTQEEEEAFDELRATVETIVLPSYVSRSSVRTYVNRYNEATIMDLDDPDEAKGFMLFCALGKMNPSRIPVILNG